MSVLPQIRSFRKHLLGANLVLWFCILLPRSNVKIVFIRTCSLLEIIFRCRFIMQIWHSYKSPHRPPASYCWAHSVLGLIMSWCTNLWEGIKLMLGGSCEWQKDFKVKSWIEEMIKRHFSRSGFLLVSGGTCSFSPRASIQEARRSLSRREWVAVSCRGEMAHL